MFNCVIIGGGAAGLFAAANLKDHNSLLLEGSKKLGQKILITGGGMCNITNRDSTDEFLSHFGGKSKENFLKPALLNLSPQKTMNWLEERGLSLTTREDGKVFPETLKAQSLIDTLYNKLTEYGIKIRYNTKVTEINTDEEGFTIKTNDGEIHSRFVVIATGGQSFPETGSDGSGYILARRIGHNIVPPSPALTGIGVENHQFSTLSGNAVRDSFVEFFREGENKRYFQGNGDLLFTHKGISGPVILNNSRFLRKGDTIYASLISTSNKEEARVELAALFNSKSSVKKVLKELGLTSSLISLIGEIKNIDNDALCNSLNKKIKSGLINTLLSFPFKVKEITFKGAMATAGGVDISEIDRKTMESRVVSGLYFAGEVIDIDGDTGGYNIQAAFSTAKLAADDINKKL